MPMFRNYMPNIIPEHGHWAFCLYKAGRFIQIQTGYKSLSFKMLGNEIVLCSVESLSISLAGITKQNLFNSWLWWFCRSCSTTCNWYQEQRMKLWYTNLTLKWQSYLWSGGHYTLLTKSDTSSSWVCCPPLRPPKVVAPWLVDSLRSDSRSAPTQIWYKNLGWIETIWCADQRLWQVPVWHHVISCADIDRTSR